MLGNPLTSLDVSNNTALKELRCHYNQLTSLDVSKNTALKELRCYGNQLTSLDVSKNTALTMLYCYENKLTSLDVSKNTALTTLDADCRRDITAVNGKFDLSELKGFDASRASKWSGAEYDKENNTLKITGNAVTYSYDCGNNMTVTFKLDVTNISLDDCINGVNALYDEGEDVIILTDLQMKMIEAVLKNDYAE